MVGAPHDKAVAAAVGAAARRFVERFSDPPEVVVQQPPVQHDLHLARRQGGGA